MNYDSELDLDQIQGNSIVGFSKDFQALLFVRIKDFAQAAATLRGSPVGSSSVGTDSILEDTVASSSERVLRFNAQFKQLKREGAPEGHISATWTHVAFTFCGLQQMKLTEADLNSFPDAFRLDMASRADLLGDVGDSAPANWEKFVDWPGVHAVIIVASDKEADVNRNDPLGRVGRYLKILQSADSGLELCAPSNIPPATANEGPGQLYGRTREDDPGHEHFGYADGISQPGVRGVDLPDDPVGNPHQGHPGQDLVHPGEFVIGYPRQQGRALPGHHGPNPVPSTVLSGDGPINNPPDRGIDPPGSRQKLPAWARNGSFLVFRRLEQDVLGFRAWVQRQSVELGISEDLFGAKVLGRFPSGAPLAARTFDSGSLRQDPVFDPAKRQPELAESDALNNNFLFGNDPTGAIVPLAAHIRKAFPRDEIAFDILGTPTTEEGAPVDPRDVASRNQAHRLLRRGLPYGQSLFSGEGGKFDDRRGLLFLCYQSDIERQFEFVQRFWVRNPDFPAENSGQDPIITPRDSSGNLSAFSLCPFHRQENGDASAKCPMKTINIQHFITTRGGGYFFSPSINTLHAMLEAQLSL